MGNKVTEFIGWIGSICLAICALPLVIDSISRGYNELPWASLWLWIVGEICVLYYVIAHKKWPLTINYGLNAIGILILMYYRTEAGV